MHLGCAAFTCKIPCFSQIFPDFSFLEYFLKIIKLILSEKTPNSLYLEFIKLYRSLKIITFHSHIQYKRLNAFTRKSIIAPIKE